MMRPTTFSSASERNEETHIPKTYSDSTTIYQSASTTFAMGQVTDHRPDLTGYRMLLEYSYLALI